MIHVAEACVEDSPGLVHVHPDRLQLNHQLFQLLLDHEIYSVDVLRYQVEQVEPFQMLAEVGHHRSEDRGLRLEGLQIGNRNAVELGNRLEWLVHQHVFQQHRAEEPHVPHSDYETLVHLCESFEILLLVVSLRRLLLLWLLWLELCIAEVFLQKELALFNLNRRGGLLLFNEHVVPEVEGALVVKLVLADPVLVDADERTHFQFKRCQAFKELMEEIPVDTEVKADGGQQVEHVQVGAENHALVCLE